jgi:cytochrome c biogenesis protein CcmG, thiol:disulfide interchange protein DsbE
MMKTLTRYWTLFSLILLLVSAAWVWNSAAPPGGTTGGRIPAPRPGFHAPDFTLQSLEGETIALSDLAGRPVLINLWASWCPPCRAEMPAMERVYQDFKDQGLVILAVNATDQDNLPSARAFVDSLGLTFTILMDPAGEVSAAYELRALPTSFFVDGQGVIREVVVGGPMSEALLRIRVQQLFEEGD